MRGFLEILERSAEPDLGTVKVAHQTMLKETERLIRMVEDLITVRYTLVAMKRPTLSSFLSQTMEKALLRVINPLYLNDFTEGAVLVKTGVKRVLV